MKAAGKGTRKLLLVREIKKEIITNKRAYKPQNI
jgi:hypothetical protein